MFLTFLLVGIAGYLKLLSFPFTILRVNVRGEGCHIIPFFVKLSPSSSFSKAELALI